MPEVGVRFIHDKYAFSSGSIVEIVQRVSRAENWGDEWIPGMDTTVGMTGIIGTGQGALGGFPVVGDWGVYFYPSCALKLAMHDAGKFKVGQKVVAVRKTPSRSYGWNNSWIDGDMDDKVRLRMVGTIMEVRAERGYLVSFAGEGENGYDWPSTSLELAGGDMGTGKAVTAQASEVKPAPVKKKRVRDTKGPWDAAPCTHLRFMLMCFFRDKLALVRAEGKADAFDVACTRCKTKITLRAQ
jgi:hypothetical protein